MKRLLMAASIIGVSATAQAVPLDLTGQPYATYGNVNSYALPILAALNGYGSGPGSPYYIASGPGQIANGVVIYTGANGQNVTINPDGFDNAYLTPSGSHPQYASISGAVNVTSPGDKAGIANNDANTWDANVASLRSLLGTGNPLFFFNNNETNSDPTLAIWAKLWITNSTGGLYCGTTACGVNGNNSGYLYLSNQGQVFNTTNININGDATAYNGGNITQPQAGTSYSTGGTDYVQSGFSTGGFNLNLGANQAAYAADVPLLDQWLQELYGTGDNLNNYTVHLDLKLGCNTDPSLGSVWSNCTGVQIDNGYEQLFLASSTANFNNVPEPGVLGLLGLSLLGLAALRVRNR